VSSAYFTRGLIETLGPLHPPGHLIFRKRDTLLQNIVPIAAIAFKNWELPIVGQDNPLGRPPFKCRLKVNIWEFNPMRR
jgi:hypothetical protein